MISVRHRDPVFISTVRTAVFGQDNWGKINDFDEVLDGAPVGRGQPFEESDLFTSFRQVFIDGDSWEATPFFRNLMKLMAKRGMIYRCTSREALLERLERDVGQIWQSMQRNGYRSQAEILDALWRETPAAADFRPFQEGRYHSSVTTNHELKVGFNEDGDILFLDGRHRFAIARLQEVPEIPAHVVFRHHLWIARKARLLALSTEHPSDRDDMALDHPDLPQRFVSAAHLPVLQAEFAANGWPMPRLRSLATGSAAGGV